MLKQNLTKLYQSIHPNILRRILPGVNRVQYYSSETDYPETCNGINYLKEGENTVLRHPSVYPDWLWTLGGPKVTLEEMSFETHDKRYVRAIRRAKLRENNMIRKSKKF